MIKIRHMIAVGWSLKIMYKNLIHCNNEFLKTVFKKKSQNFAVIMTWYVSFFICPLHIFTIIIIIIGLCNILYW